MLKIDWNLALYWDFNLLERSYDIDSTLTCPSARNYQYYQTFLAGGNAWEGMLMPYSGNPNAFEEIIGSLYLYRMLYIEHVKSCFWFYSTVTKCWDGFVHLVHCESDFLSKNDWKRSKNHYVRSIHLTSIMRLQLCWMVQFLMLLFENGFAYAVFLLEQR